MAIEINGTTGVSGVDGSTSTPALQGADTNTGVRFGTDTVAIVTGGSDRVVTDASGNLLVGTTSARTGVYSLTLESSNSYFMMRAGGTGSLSQVSFVRNTDSSATQVGFISTTGSATTYSTSSDYRLKENVVPMTGALEFVRRQRPVKYTWKADGSEGSGYIAHWMQEDGAGNCVTGEKDAVDADGNPQYQGIDTSFMVAPLNAAVNELADIVDQQQTLIQDLTARLEALEAK